MSSVRRSERLLAKSTKAKNDEKQAEINNIEECKSEHSIESTKLSNTTNNTAKINRKKLEAKLEYERKKAEKEQQLLQLELELKMAKIDEENETNEEFERKERNGFGDNDVQDDLSVKSTRRETQRWVEHQRSVADQSEKNNESYLHQIMTRNSISKDLPIFDGNPIDWPNFISHFRNTTKICGFSNEENQHRLQKCIKGKAKEVVQALLILPQNVDKAISTLEKRFGRPEYIVSHLLQKIKRIPIIKEDKLESLIYFSDTVNNLVCTLQILKEEDHLRNPILLQELVNKLPINCQMQWTENISKENLKGKLSEFQVWLEMKAEAASRLQIPLFLDDKIEYSKSKYQNKRETTLVVDKNKTFNKNCLICKSDNHPLEKCSKYKNAEVDERWKIVTSNNICFSCLKSGHRSVNCRNKTNCRINDCKKLHHETLHKEFKTNYNKEETNCHILSPNKVLLKILPVKLKAEGGVTLNTFALLDDASTVTLLDENIADFMKLKGPVYPLSMQWTNDQTQQQGDSRVVSLTISGKNSKSFQLRHVRTIKKLSLPTQTFDAEDLQRKYPYLKNYQISSMTDVKPVILIGQDNWPLLINRTNVFGKWNGPVVSKTLLGCVVHGNCGTISSYNSQRHFTCHVYHHNDDIDVLQEMVRSQWKIESLGIKPMTNVLSKDDVRAQKILNETTKRIGNKFEIGLLWKKDIILPNESRKNAFQRLLTTEKKMEKNPLFAEAYCNKMQEYLDKGYIKKLSANEALISTSKTWYLPHFGVINPNKPGKIRIVFDAAAKAGGRSLNDNLLTGPDLFNSLLSILMNFRIKKIAFVADIKEMFLQVRIRKEDQCSQRFLWRGKNREHNPDTYEIQVVFFGSTCGPCLAQEVKNINAKEYLLTYTEAANDIIKKHYMDDYLGGANSEEEAIKLINDVIYVHKQGGFTICNWICNSKNVLKKIDPKLTAIGEKNLNINTEVSTERILGLWWNPSQDIFTFNTKFHKIDKAILNGERRPSKREILKVVMSIFDPLGFVANYVVQGKILLQEIWRSGLGWDDEITNNLHDKWKNWLQDIDYIKKFKIQRTYTKYDLKASINDLHVFNDASENAYASVVYLRSQKGKQVEVSFICAKTRVTPLKPLSIPRLELQAALMGARLIDTIKKDLEIHIESTVCWTDSKTVLHWIQSEARRFKPFVAQRVGEIQELTNTYNWKYVPSIENVADEATKRSRTNDSSRWILGPNFLQQPSEEWPKERNQNIHINPELLEERSQFVQTCLYKESLPIPDPNRFSRWYRIVRSTAWMLRFIHKCKSKLLRINCDWQRSRELQPEEIEKAETLLFRQIQNDIFFNEINWLKGNKPFNKSSKLYNMVCILDENKIIRLNGRLNNAIFMDENQRKPIILDPNHILTKLLIKQYHENVNHHGIETVISNLRQRFWIIKIRQAVKKSWKECQRCKNSKLLPKNPIMGQLPTCRIEPTIRPFLKAGVDYFGPLEVKVKRSHEKRYGVLFTCMTTRAIHLEIAHDLSTDGFIHVFRQFGCRRGFPLEIYCDNGTNFVGAERELRNSLRNWNQDEIVKYCTMRNTKWFFNPPSAPHMGGVWERQIRAVKISLREVLKERYPQEYVLKTLFAEIENIINSRPLTHVPLNSEDEDPITPNHFLIGPLFLASPCTKSCDSDLFLLNKWKAAQKLTDLFWKKWVQQYLPTLLNRNKWNQSITTPLKIGDIVVIVDSNEPRNSWPKGKIVATYPAKDGKIRIVDIQTKSGIYRRPVSKLCKMDVAKEMSK